LGTPRHPSELLKVGQQLESLCLTSEKERVSLGLKQTQRIRGIRSKSVFQLRQRMGRSQTSFHAVHLLRSRKA
jgi:ribosomal protein S1